MMTQNHPRSHLNLELAQSAELGLREPAHRFLRKNDVLAQLVQAAALDVTQGGQVSPPVGS